ncbi:MAG TPA: biliverdin-producing heme oxygenase [Edaphobacter sp.]|nr:biliverdin-producing heme oxygenase [Edaphobacter sp.]
MDLSAEYRTLNLERLRRETTADHAAVEKTVPLMEEDLSREDYVRYLRQIHGVVAAWEERSAEVSPEWMRAILAARQRREMLERDLRWFSVASSTDERPVMPMMSDEASLLGAMYVMEGSTLGGQLIAAHVARVLGLKDGQGDAYFRGHGRQTGTMWREFCEVLRTRVTDDESEAAIRAAKAMFQVFGSWMQR